MMKDIYIVLVVMACILGAVFMTVSTWLLLSQWFGLLVSLYAATISVSFFGMAAGGLMMFIVERTVK